MAAIHKIDTVTLQQWIKRDEAIIYDVREIEEYDMGHIPTAINTPLSTLSIDQITIPENDLQRLVFYCKAGMRSQQACELLFTQNINRDVWNYAPSFMEWDRLGLPTQK